MPHAEWSTSEMTRSQPSSGGESGAPSNQSANVTDGTAEARGRFGEIVLQTVVST